MTHLATLRRDVPETLERVGAVAGDLEALFEDLYQDRYGDVYRYVLLMLRSHEEAQDIASETFHRAYAAWSAGRGPRGESLPWLLVIARNLVVDHRRRRRLVSWLPFELAGKGREAADGSAAERSEFWIWFDEMARDLPDRQREVLILRYQRDLDDDQIGEIMGLSASGVRSLVARACAALRRHPEIWQ
jgi:RNA polymerase sigma-70 factor, ECF subfamily